MNISIRIGVSLAALASISTPALAEHGPEEAALLDVIRVTGRPLFLQNALNAEPGALPDTAPDAASLVARLSGANLIDNGGLSGQVQYHGLFGPRINLRVDGQSFSSGGPNLMDPPLHYAPLPLIDHIMLDRGISPCVAVLASAAAQTLCSNG